MEGAHELLASIQKDQEQTTEALARVSQTLKQLSKPPAQKKSRAPRTLPPWLAAQPDGSVLVTELQLSALASPER